MINTFIIINKEKEQERYNYIQNQIKNYNLDKTLNINYFNFIWGNEINSEIRNKYCKSDWSMRKHDRTMEKNPLSNGEISLFLNHLECLKNIKNTFNDGIFIILESDVIFKPNFNEDIIKIVKSLNYLNDWDIINIGEGTRDYLKNRGYPKSQPNIINNFYFYKENINSCIEGLIWNYKSINKFLDYFDKTEDIDSPIDTKIDVLSTYIGNFNIHWLEPSLVNQGSFIKLFNSHLR